MSPVEGRIKYWPARYTVVGLSILAVLICYMDRINISVAIIPMSAELGWDAEMQGVILSSFFAGYLMTQVIGGRLADRFGGKIVLGIAVLAWSAFTFVTPLATFAGMALLLAARVGMGMGEGVALPAIYSLYGRWLPRHENSRAIGATFSAIPLGIIVGLLLTPSIISHAGWPWVFYSFGILGLFWFMAWQRLVSAHPDLHPGLREEERALISRDAVPLHATEPPPWGKLLSTPAVWAIIIGHFCSNWGTYVLLAWMPTWLTQGMGVDFASVGLFAMFPYIASFFFFNVAGVLADHLVSKGFNRLRIRKSMQAVGFGGPAIVLLVVGYVDDSVTAVSLMTLANVFIAFSAGGFIVNHLDIAPRYAGVLMGLSNTAGTIPGIVGVYASGLILSMTGSWLLVFQCAAAVYGLGLVVYLVFASSERLFD